MTSKESVAVVGLAFHITYWDHLGWKDPYSQPEFTSRQKKYDEFLTTQQYTPQVVVNGEFEFVGGNPIAFRNAIAKAVSTPYYFSLDATATHSDNKVTIRLCRRQKIKIGIIKCGARANVRRESRKEWREQKSRTKAL